MNVFIEGNCGSTASLMRLIVPNMKQVFQPKMAHFVVFTGGSDVSPFVYGESQSQLCYTDARRDIECNKIWEDCFDRDTKILGICRGAQFISAKLGGKLVQHIVDHCEGSSHKTDTGLIINSLHHQAILRHKELGEILHTCEYPFSGFMSEYEYVEDIKNVESFMADNLFGVQWHPEFMLHSVHSNGNSIFADALDWWVEKGREFVRK